MATDTMSHDARLVPGVAFLFETHCGKFGRAKLLDLFPWSDKPYKLEYIVPGLGKVIEQFSLAEFSRIVLMPMGMAWSFLSRY